MVIITNFSVNFQKIDDKNYSISPKIRFSLICTKCQQDEQF